MVCRSLYIIVAAAAALVILVVSGNSQGLGLDRGRMAGTFVELLEVGPGVSFNDLVILNMDGTAVGSVGVMFGGVPDNPHRFSPFQGVWDRTGQRSVAGTVLWHTFDANTGVLVSYGRARISAEYSDYFNRYDGTSYIETLSCPTPLSCPDPLDPAATWTPDPGMPTTGYPVSGKRVELVPAP